MERVADLEDEIGRLNETMQELEVDAMAKQVHTSLKMDFLFIYLNMYLLYRVNHGGLRQYFVDFYSGVMSGCPFAMPYLPNFHLPKESWADRVNKIVSNHHSHPVHCWAKL